MELRQLRYFVRIAELGSVSRAAESLHVAQSALSRHLATMEHQFGQPLLLRSGRGVSLTPAGRELLRYAQAMLRLGEDARTAVAETAGAPAGPVAVGFPLSLTAALALPLVEAVTARYPRVELRLFDEISGVLADQLRAGRLHMALLFDDGQLDGLRPRPVLEERLYLVVGRGTPLAARQQLSLHELAEVPLAIPSPAHGVRALVDAALQRIGRKASVWVEANSVTVMKQVAASGRGAAVMSAASIASELASGELVAVALDDPGLQRRAVACLSSVEPRPAAADAVFQLLVSGCRALAAAGRWSGCRALGDEPPRRAKA